jgi:uncharacterized repeat protein (TIGR04076 family)
LAAHDKGSPPYDVVATVKSVKGVCTMGIKPGHKVYFENGKTIKGDMCFSSLLVVLPRAWALRFGAGFPWEKDKDTMTFGCPDPVNQVVWELKRIRK